MQLKPRTKTEESSGTDVTARMNKLDPFGGAKPRDENIVVAAKKHEKENESSS